MKKQKLLFMIIVTILLSTIFFSLIFLISLISQDQPRFTYSITFDEVKEIEPEYEFREGEAWNLKIDSVGIEGKIKEGTSLDVMADSIGHFEESRRWVRKCMPCFS